MKVVAINSSKRKRFTYGLLCEIKEILNSEGIEVEIINLYDFDIKDCNGCEVCILKGKCTIKDDMDFLMEKLRSCDGVILSSPVYLRNVSGKLKTFVDRTCMWYHRPHLYGKPLLSVSTTKGSGLKFTLKYIEDVGVQWGMYPSGRIGRSIRNVDVPVSKGECSKFISSLRMSKCDHKPSFKSVIDFNVQKAMAKSLAELDKKYWQDNGFLNQSYFYKCRLNPLKKLCGDTVFKILDMAMKNADTNNSDL